MQDQGGSAGSGGQLEPRGAAPLVQERAQGRARNSGQGIRDIVPALQIAAANGAARSRPAKRKGSPLKEPACKLQRGDLHAKRGRGVTWSDSTEHKLLERMAAKAGIPVEEMNGAEGAGVPRWAAQKFYAAVGIAGKEGVAVTSWRVYMPFAKTIERLFEHRSQRSIAQKVRKLLVKGPSVANKVWQCKARSGAAGLLGVYFHKLSERSRPRSRSPPVRWPALRRRGPLPPPTLAMTPGHTPRRWRAQIVIEICGKQHFIGCFDDKLEAARAFDRCSPPPPAPPSAGRRPPLPL